jgi:hypothetical protein
MKVIGMTPKRKKVQDRILQIVKTADPTGLNAQRYEKLFDRLDDKQFHHWMEELRVNKNNRKLTLFAPNLKNNLKVDNLLKAADALNLKLFERVRIYDAVSKRYFLTPVEYLILDLPVRRLKQSLEDKMSIPTSDRRTSQLTGQVIKPDASSSVSMVEQQIMVSKGLIKVATELGNIRGGNIEGYASFVSDIENTGTGNLSEVDPSTRPRSADTVRSLFLAMHLDNNL